MCNSIFFFNDTATTEIYTLSLHDALPICFDMGGGFSPGFGGGMGAFGGGMGSFGGGMFGGGDMLYGGNPQYMMLMQASLDRKSTRLNSSHANISYAVFCLKKKKIIDFNIL